MNQNDFFLKNLGINTDALGKIQTFVDYGNVDRWFDKDTSPFLGKIIEKEEKISISIEKLGKFIDNFSQKKYFYYGFYPERSASLHIKVLADKTAKFVTVTKPVQKIKHYLNVSDKIDKNHYQVSQDLKGSYIYVYKCNFDVEMTIDVIRLAGHYDTLAIFTSDRDFIALLKYVKNLGKKIILFYSGPTAAELKDLANIKINGQQIRELIGELKKKNSATLSGDGT